MNKTLLIISGGAEAVPGIRLAKDLGFHVVVSDMNPRAPGFAIADGRIVASTYDVEETVKAARDFHQNRRPINGVMCVASDVPLTVARTAEALDLPGIPVEAATLASNKLKMKQRFKKHRVPIPLFCEVQSERELIKALDEFGLPAVIKPVDSRGSRGVLQIREPKELGWYLETARSQSPTGRVMVESFEFGPQISTESVILDGKAYTPGFSERNYEFLDLYAPYIIENGGQMPSLAPDGLKQQVDEVIEAAAAALGIKDGIVKGDIVISKGEPLIIEMAARLSGGYFCTHQIPLSTGVFLVEAAIRLAIGAPLDPEDYLPKFHKGSVIRFFFPKPGKVVSIQGVENARKIPGVKMLQVTANLDDVIPRPVNSNCNAGVVVARSITRDKAIQIAGEAIRAVQIETEPMMEEAYIEDTYDSSPPR